MLGWGRLAFGVALFAVVAFTAARDWRDVHATISRLSVLQLAGAEALALLGLGASVLTWRRALSELGSSVRLPAAGKIYLIGQLGKYVPGSVWAFVMQMELGRSAGISRTRVVASSVLAIGINLVVGFALGLPAVSELLGGGTWVVVLAVCALIVAAVALTPPGLSFAARWLARMTPRVGRLGGVTWGGILSAAGWSIVSATCFGLSLWVLVLGHGNGSTAKTLWLCIAGTALAMTAGFLVVIAPSGLGVREATLVAVLAPTLKTSEALAFALVLRLVFTVADLVAAGITAPVRTGTSRRVPDPLPERAGFARRVSRRLRPTTAFTRDRTR